MRTPFFQGAANEAAPILPSFRARPVQPRPSATSSPRPGQVRLKCLGSIACLSGAGRAVCAPTRAAPACEIEL